MIKKLKIRAILDVEEDVFRDVEIVPDSNLIDLHLAFRRAFDFQTDEMASFYFTDDLWDQGDEIPMEDMFDDGVLTMRDIPLSSIFKKKSDRLIYVYDFLNLWTFFVEFVEEVESKNMEAETVFVYGEMPKEAPEKNMIINESLDDSFNIDIDLESLDEETNWN